MGEPVEDKDKKKPRMRDVTVPGQAGARIINEEVTSPLQDVVRRLKKKQKKD